MSRKTKKWEKLYTEENFSDLKKTKIKKLQNQLDNDSLNMNNTPDNSGVFQTDVPEVDITFIMPPSKVPIATNTAQTAQIILGRDRPCDLVSGYGGMKGAQRANAIDLVVGRKSAANNGMGPDSGTPVDNDFAQDAARIYISEMTDVDVNFGLAAGKHGYVKARSAIGIKADHVRVIGREGVKIVTGKAHGFANLGLNGELNSKGGTITVPCPPIELNAGNVGDGERRRIRGGLKNPSEEINMLQPLSMGENNRDALSELSSILDDLMGAIFSFATIQTTLNGVLGVTPLPHHVAACSAATTALATQVVGPLYHTRVNKIMWEVNYLEKFGMKYVCSKNVFTS